MGGGYLNALLLQPIFGSIVICDLQWNIVNDIENILGHYTKISFHRYRFTPNGNLESSVPATMWLDYPTLGGSTWGYSSTVNWIRRVVWFLRVALRQLTLIQLSLLLQNQNISSRHLPMKIKSKERGIGLFFLSKEGRRGFVFLSRQIRSLTFAGASPFLGVLEMSTVLLLCLMPILEICGKLDLKKWKKWNLLEMWFWNMEINAKLQLDKEQ